MLGLKPSFEHVMWTLIVEVANVARLTATVAPDRIIADQASFPIRMWKGLEFVIRDASDVSFSAQQCLPNIAQRQL